MQSQVLCVDFENADTSTTPIAIGGQACSYFDKLSRITER